MQIYTLVPVYKVHQLRLMQSNTAALQCVVISTMLVFVGTFQRDVNSLMVILEDVVCIVV